MSGFYVVSRKLNDPFHDLHPHSTGETACSAWAWVDLIGMARWKQSGGVSRGHVPASERFLATRWNWHRSRVSRFLDSLEEKDRIRREPQTGRKPGRIIICNYDNYQNLGSTSGSTSEPREGPRKGPREGPKKNQNQNQNKDNNPPAGVKEVFDHWREVSGHTRCRLTDERKKKIRARLRTYTVDELKKALEVGCSDPFYKGDNDRKTRYDFPETLLKNDSKVDQFLNAKNGSSNHPDPEERKQRRLRELGEDGLEEIRRRKERMESVGQS